MHFLLIHGSWHGAWCWHKILPRLHAEGHTATAIDLPGRGRSPASAPLVGLSRMVRDVVKALPTDRQTTLVVHSRYGVVASQVAETVPERLAQTIYLASFMLPSGAACAPYFLADRDSELGTFVEVNRRGLWDRMKPEGYRQVLYHDCSEDDNALAASLLCREPLRPAIAKLNLSEARYGRVPRAYIRLTQDRAVSLSLQDRMIAETKVERVDSIDAGHSAYFSQPDALSRTILAIART